MMKQVQKNTVFHDLPLVLNRCNLYKSKFAHSRFILSFNIKQESRMAYAPADNTLLEVSVIFR